MPRVGFTSLTVKDEIVALLDDFVAKNNEGFTKRNEVLYAAVREFLDRRRGRYGMRRA